MANGIRITGRKKETSKLLSHIASFMFEQEYGEMNGWSSADIAALNKAKEVLSKHA